MLGYSAQNQPGVAGIAGGRLPVDAIDQFSIQSNAGADMGRNGANVNMVIKSGTNTFHLTAYYFNRNEFFADPSPILPAGSRPAEIRNSQPGFSLGGPIVKNKTFFFVSGEIQEAIAGESISDTLPSAAWVGAGEAELAKYGVAVNPVSPNLLTIWPSSALTGPATTNNYLANAINTYNSFNGLAKLDHRFNDKHSLSIRYFGSGGTQIADVILGFTHISGKDRNGSYAVKRKTISKRMRAKLLEIKQQLRSRMHEPVAQNGKWLRSIVQGYFNYHAVPGNIDSLSAFRYRVIRLWRTTMIHRGGKRHLTWARMQRLAERWIPQPRVLHPYPRVRFDATHPR